MPNTPEQNNKFKYESNYNKIANFSHVRFGHDVPILETELNEMQIIQDKRLSSILSNMIPSGFVEKVKREFNGESIIYNPSSNGVDLTMHIAIAPFRAIVAGKELNCDGNFSYGGLDNYILINLGDSPISGLRDDLVYLEAWYEVVGDSDRVYENGYQGGDIILNSMVDSRIQKETSRRVMLCWNVRVVKDINFINFPDGFGYTNVNKFSPIYAMANGQLPSYNVNYIYASANNTFFQGEDFYGDGGLYVAGRKDYIPSSSNLYQKYVFAIPMFRIKRRNTSPFTLNNFNGTSIVSYALNKNSALDGDINGNVRPDKLTYNYIVDRDVIDLRSTVNFDHMGDYYRDDAFIKLINGNLQTKDKEKIKRIQFGTTYNNYKENANTLLYCKFDKTITPFVPGMDNPVFSFSGDNPKYGDSAFGSGVILNGRTSFNYRITTLTCNEATIDFFMQPNWNSADSTNDITLLTIADTNNNPAFVLKKEDTLLNIYQYYDAAQTSGTVNKTSVDLTNTLLLSNNLYHVRISYNMTNSLNGIYIYLNGKLHAQGNYMGSQLLPNMVTLGKIETTNGEQVIISDFTIYSIAYEQSVSNTTGYSVSNIFWPMLPSDVISSDAVLLPSFNSDLLSFSDNPTAQRVVAMLDGIIQNGNSLFTLYVPTTCVISSVFVPIVYDVYGAIIAGQWSGLSTASAVFTVSGSVSGKVVVVYDMIVPNGHGGGDIPDDILFAGFIKNEGLTEISYHRKNSATPRPVSYFKPRRISGNLDTTYDFSIKDRDNKYAFARLLNYYVNGNSTNQYTIPMSLYGYEVIYVKEVVNKGVVRCSRIPPADSSSSGTFIIELKDIILPTETIHFVLALGGCCFDFEPNSKTLIDNMHTTKLVTFTADGMNDTYVIPCFDADNINGGILKSAATFVENTFNAYNVISSTTERNICYFNNEMYYSIPIYDDNGVYTGRSNHLLSYYTIDSSSFGTPFIKVTFPSRPQSGTKISIPVLVSYQPTYLDSISMWVKYTPYQGILGSDKIDVKRVSEWKFFITTLGSGKTTLQLDYDILHSLSNAVNRLPGGLGNAYLMDGSDVELNCFGTMTARSDIHKQFVLYDTPFFGSQDGIFDHNQFKFLTSFSLMKTRSNFQDGVINLSGNKFKLYFPDSYNSIYKYTGMYCTVVDEKGRMLLLVIGCFNDKTASKIIKLEPEFADLFLLEDRPSIIMRG